ncbi:MAG: glycosyltransferase family 4 protein [Deltaproteobacteria bacterium]|nr:glycosyltransferase family 4 protein [Deltaproteobacteria bacterium]
MKILHIISDWKWTGPAEPVVNLCRELQDRGHDVTLAIADVHGDNHPVLRENAIKQGVKLFEGLHMRRRVKPATFSDVLALKQYIKKEKFDIVHCHLTHDHALSAFSVGGNDAVKLIRTSHKGGPLKNSFGNRFMMKRTAGLITVSQLAGREDSRNFSFPPERVAVIQNAIDLKLFSPRAKNKKLMKELGIAPGDVVAGIVARLQRHRRYEVFLEAMKEAAKIMPNLKAIIVGRGTYAEQVAYRPVREMGLEKTVILAGYRKDDYMDVLALFDMKVFLVPGSDGSCRALRELMAMGKPAIAAKRGMLPEIVDDGADGYIIDDTPENLRDAILKLAGNEEGRLKMGEKARLKANSLFSLSKQGEKVEEYYQSIFEIKS